MKFENKVFLSFTQSLLAKNGRFKSLHKGETCYIFGNGVSLKSMDLKLFSNKVSIGCNSLFVHNDFNKLDCRYYQIPPSFLFFPYRTYYGKFQRNYLGDLYREKIRLCKKTNFFISLSNRLSIGGENIFFEHHFGEKKINDQFVDMQGVFSFMGGTLHAMLGTAIYMGFDSAVLVGCDYLMSQKLNGHFFEKGKGVLLNEKNNGANADLFKFCQNYINLSTIVPAGMQSDIIEYTSYDEYFGAGESYKENTELVDSMSLDYLNKQGFYEIY